MLKASIGEAGGVKAHPLYLGGGQLRYRTDSGLPLAALVQAKSLLEAGAEKAEFAAAGKRWVVRLEKGNPPAPVQVKPQPVVTTPVARPVRQKRNGLTGVPVWAVTIQASAGRRVLEFEAATADDATAGADKLKLTVVSVEPVREYVSR